MQPKHISFDNFSPFLAGSISIHMSLLVSQNSSKVKFPNSVLLGFLNTEYDTIETVNRITTTTVIKNHLLNFIFPRLMNYLYSPHKDVSISILELCRLACTLRSMSP